MDDGSSGRQTEVWPWVMLLNPSGCVAWSSPLNCSYLSLLWLMVFQAMSLELGKSLPADWGT